MPQNYKKHARKMARRREWLHFLTKMLKKLNPDKIIARESNVFEIDDGAGNTKYHSLKLNNSGKGAALR